MQFLYACASIALALRFGQVSPRHLLFLAHHLRIRERFRQIQQSVYKRVCVLIPYESGSVSDGAKTLSYLRRLSLNPLRIRERFRLMQICT